MYLRAIAGIVRKDISQMMFRSNSITLSISFGAILILIFALSGTPFDLSRETISGVIWSAFSFSAVVMLNASLRLEKETGGIDLMKLAGLPHGLIYVAKAVSGLVMMFVSNVVIAFLAFLFLDIPATPGFVIRILIVGMLGMFGLCASGTLVSTITAEIEGGMSLIVVLLMPLILPVLIASSRLFALIIGGNTLDIRWIAFDIGYFVIFTSLSFLLYEEVIEQ